MAPNVTQWDFSPDEFLFLTASGIYTAVEGFHFLNRSFASRRPALALLSLPLLAGLAITLHFGADPAQVAGHFDYELLFLIGGAALLLLSLRITEILGISYRDDAIDRRNPAAYITVAATITSTTVIYAGANLGAGPTIWTTLLPAAIALLTAAYLWFAVESLTPPSGLSDAIAIDRDIPTAVRHGFIFLALSLILARSVAGDWTGWVSTGSDFLAYAWPVIPLAASAVALQRRFPPTHPPRLLLTTAILPGLLYLLLALAWLAYLGKPPIGKTIITYEQQQQSSTSSAGGAP